MCLKRCAVELENMHIYCTHGCAKRINNGSSNTPYFSGMRPVDPEIAHLQSLAPHSRLVQHAQPCIASWSLYPHGKYQHNTSSRFRGTENGHAHAHVQMCLTLGLCKLPCRANWCINIQNSSQSIQPFPRYGKEVRTCKCVHTLGWDANKLFLRDKKPGWVFTGVTIITITLTNFFLRDKKPGGFLWGWL